MGIDCMEINDIQITPDRERLGRGNQTKGGLFVCFIEKFHFVPFSIPNA